MSKPDVPAREPIFASEIRAEVLRVMHALTAGLPTADPDDLAELAARRLTARDIRFTQAAGPEELALLNAILQAEHEQRERNFATLERLLAYAQFDVGDLDDRLYALPPRAFANAALCCLALGWID